MDFDGELCFGADDAFFSAPRPKRTEAFDPSEEAFDLDLFPVGKDSAVGYFVIADQSGRRPALRRMFGEFGGKAVVPS